MNIGLNLAGTFQNRPFIGGLLKSTQEKMERQQECENKVAFYENRISMLKEMKSDSLEDISRKLEMFHSYQDSIAAAKEEYNNQQMYHVLDEAKERGEQIADAVDEYAPKTSEERREEMAEEALGTDEEKGELTESMEELTEMAEDMTEEMLSADSQSEILDEAESAENLSDIEAEADLFQKQAEKQPVQYKRIDILI